MIRLPGTVRMTPDAAIDPGAVIFVVSLSEPAVLVETTFSLEDREGFEAVLGADALSAAGLAKVLMSIGFPF